MSLKSDKLISNNDVDESCNLSDPINCWEELKCKKEVLRGIYSYGFEKPSPIQSKAIRPLISKKDLIAQAQSGTGKTGCFLIGALELIDMDEESSQIIIIVPTRELAIQIQNVVTGLSCHIKNFKSELLVGGISCDLNINSLKNNPQLLIGCPGRIFDMIQRKYLDITQIKTIIIDEADEMLSSGFKEQIYNIFQKLNNNVQVALFSATLPQDICLLTEKFMRDPVKVLVKAEQLTLEGISQYYINLEDDNDKYLTLKDLFQRISVAQSIIYCNSIQRVNDLYEVMTQDNFPVCRIHSNITKEERLKSYNDFLQGKFRVLISSNVTSRGIDIQQVSTVINFDVPNCIHNYIHRIGRSGRFGRKGLGINFITKRDIKKLKEIESFYNTSIGELPENFTIN